MANQFLSIYQKRRPGYQPRIGQPNPGPGPTTAAPYPGVTPTYAPNAPAPFPGVTPTNAPPAPQPYPGVVPTTMPSAVPLPGGGPRVNFASGGATRAAGVPAPATPDYSLGANNDRSNAAMTAAGTAGSSANTDYYNRLESFDPSKSVSQYASSAWDAALNDPVNGLKRSLENLRGSAVGAGRLDTGFFDSDSGDVINNATRSYQDMLGQTALEATRMGQANTEAIGQYGQNQQNQYLDLLTAQREQQMNDAREKAARQRQKKRGIGSLIGTVAGGAIGSFIPGVGTAIGAGIGGQIGGGF